MASQKLMLALKIIILGQLGYLAMSFIWTRSEHAHKAVDIFVNSDNDTWLNKIVNVTEAEFGELLGPLLLPAKARPKSAVGDDYLMSYGKYCQSHFPSYDVLQRARKTSTPLCPCISPHLEGHISVSSATENWDTIENLHPELQIGGAWNPKECVARQRIAFIVPYRNRESHLKSLMKHLHPILQRQQIEYRIFVVEQTFPDLFNKAAVMNAGFKEVKEMMDFDCVVFHDVDMLLEDDRNIYTCGSSPMHLAPFVNKFGYKLIYPNMFGGAISMTQKQFYKVNGFSNRYFGWGGEDDDMFHRVKSANYTVIRPPVDIAKYKMIKHSHDKTNPINFNSGIALKKNASAYEEDGLTNIGQLYKLTSINKTRLFTWIHVSLVFDTKNLDEYNKKYEYSLVQRQDCIGNNLMHFALNQPECQERCSEIDDCVAFVTVDGTNLCYLKKDNCSKVKEAEKRTLYIKGKRLKN